MRILASRLRLFCAIVVSGIVAVPTVNLARGHATLGNGMELFNVDPELSMLNRLLYVAGISTKPGQVVIGNQGWLYLGDDYEFTRTVTRRGEAPGDAATGRAAGAAAEAWDAWTRQRGVRMYRVIVVPNKETIYPEYLPRWAMARQPSRTDALVGGAGPAHYIDLRPALRQARPASRAPLYYKTDTHWNLLGANAAFEAFANKMGLDAPELRWPGSEMYTVGSVTTIDGGDLARFLHMGGVLRDDYLLAGAALAAIKTTRNDFLTGRPLYEGGNPPIAAPRGRPVRVVSPGALNARKVLWLRDSFGDAMAPLMAATFTETLQMHWEDALRPQGPLPVLVDSWKPDYVFVTVVERMARHRALTAMPPSQ